MRFLFFLLSLFLIFNLSKIDILAQNSPDFSVSYDVIYKIDDSGQTTVTQKGFLTNLTDKKYVTSIVLNFNATNLDNISAYDDYGPIATEVTASGQTTSIKLPFNHQLLGIGKNMSFNLSFTNENIAKRMGKIWQINIPKAEKSTDIVSYNVNVEVPDSFGPLSYASIKPISNLFWTKDKIQDKDLLLAFGKYQLFDFSAKYNLRNLSPFFIEKTITVPGKKSDNLDFIIENINPEPTNISSLGTHLSFIMFPFESKEVVLTGQIQEFPNTEKGFFWQKDNQPLRLFLQTFSPPDTKTISVSEKNLLKNQDSQFGKIRKGLSVFWLNLVLFTTLLVVISIFIKKRKHL